jgi:hypothetical protein
MVAFFSRYEWVEVVEHDVETGIVLMFGASLLAVLVSLCMTCGRGEATPDPQKRQTPAHPAGRTKLKR